LRLGHVRIQRIGLIIQWSCIICHSGYGFGSEVVVLYYQPSVDILNEGAVLDHVKDPHRRIVTIVVHLFSRPAGS